MRTVNNRIAELRKSKKLTQQALACQLELSRSALSNYESDISVPELDIAARIARFFGVSVEYLFGKNDNPGNTVLIPVYGKIAAGPPIEAREDVLGYEEVDRAMTLGRELMCLKISGHSMEPRICDGDVAVIAKQPDVDNGEIAAVMVGSDEATLKRINRTDGGLLLIPINPTYKTMFYSKEEAADLPVTILGKLIELRAKF